MKHTFQLAIAMMAITCIQLASLSAQDAAAQRRGQTNPAGQGANAGKLDAKAPGANIRASKLMGTNIQNSQGKSVGEINDIVIDSTTGKISYAAVTYGGFLGVGNKMFAVPFEAFQVRMDPDRASDRGKVSEDDYVLILDVTQKQLEGQQGFDENNWPNMADAQWAADLDKHYGVERGETAFQRTQRLNR